MQCQCESLDITQSPRSSLSHGVKSASRPTTLSHNTHSSPPHPSHNTPCQKHKMSIHREMITIGVELELFLLNLPDGTDKYEFIDNALEPLARSINTKSIRYNSEHRESRNGAEKVFQLKEDGSIIPYPPTGLPLEIATPVLRNSSWESIIPEMCMAITSRCNHYRVAIGFNNTTGLHFHVGIGRAYTLQELKRISKAIVIFEKQMDSHHPRSHYGYNPARANLMGSIYPCRENPNLRGKTDTEMLATIDGAASVEALVVVINGDTYENRRATRYFKYNLKAALGVWNTIEFRQAAATSNSQEIVAWIEHVIKFVTSAAETPDEQFLQWAREPPGAEYEEVFCRFGVPVPTVVGNILQRRIQRIPRQVVCCVANKGCCNGHA